MTTKLCVCFTPELLILLGRVKLTNNTFIVKNSGVTIKCTTTTIIIINNIITNVGYVFPQGSNKKKNGHCFDMGC
jgi:hypothetical protein